MLRRSFLAVLGLLLTACLALVPAAIAEVNVAGLHFEVLASGLDFLIDIAHAGDERLFLVHLDGQILIYDGTEVLEEPFLDLRDRVLSGGEQGLLSLAFHPDYTTNGFFFVDYTDLSGRTVISRFSVSPDPAVADPASEAVLLRIPQPFGNHNGGQVHFGPDGFLYISTGDGGSANDPFCNAQDGTSLLGKILRLDVDSGASSPPLYTIPSSNPFVGDANIRDEVWSLGLRNPWRFSFDRETGAVVIADVGQAAREEVDYQPASSDGGENYGWKMMEGLLCTNNTEGCRFGIPGCDSAQYTAPVLTYDHNGGRCSITGGYVYRGSAIPRAFGAYFFGDFCSGDVWAAEIAGSGWSFSRLAEAVPQLVTFGEDAAGELYLGSLDTLYRLTSSCGDTVLCLGGGRFEVKVDWRTADGAGPGQVVTSSDDSGLFWFFAEKNWEMLVKIIDGCSFNDRFWVFAAATTNVEYTLRVADTETGEVALYTNPLGVSSAAITDTGAFATCP